MGQLVKLRLAPPEAAALFQSLGDIRREYRLTLLQAAKALGISTATLERMEAAPLADGQSEDVRRKYEAFVVAGDLRVGANLLFRTYPIRVARELLGYEIEQMSQKYGYSVSSWKKIESGSRSIDRRKLIQIEHDVRESFANACALSL